VKKSQKVLLCCGLVSLSLSGCAVIAVADVAATVAMGAIGLAADAAIGTVRIAGKVVGATSDAVTAPASTE
jgi:hypothetical protein